MADRIAELRALLPKRPVPGIWLSQDTYAALLDCAEALTEIVGCPQGVDEATIPAGGVDVHPEQVVVNMSVGLVRLRRAQAALAAINGDDHD